MLVFLAVIGFIGFIVFLILAIVATFKKNGKSKRNFLITLVMFILFIVGAVNSGSSKASTEEKKTQKKAVVSSVSKTENLPTMDEIKTKVKSGISFPANYNNAKKSLHITPELNISIGNGNVGSVLKAKDGYVVANIDGEKITSVSTFKNMNEVKNYEKEMLAKADKEDKEKNTQRAKEKEATFKKNIESLITSSKGVIIDVRENKYAPKGSHNQWEVVVSDAWYNSPKYEKERFADTVGNTVENYVKQGGYVKAKDSVIVDFVDRYEKTVAKEKVFMGGYKIKE